MAMADQQKVMVYRTAHLSMTVNDPKPKFSSPGHSLTLNISEIAKDTAIDTMEGK